MDINIKDYYSKPEIYKSRKTKEDYKNALENEYKVMIAIQATVERMIKLNNSHIQAPFSMLIGNTLYIIDIQNRETIEVVGKTSYNGFSNRANYCEIQRKVTLSNDKLRLIDVYWLKSFDSEENNPEKITTIYCEYNGLKMTNYLFNIESISYNKKL